MQSQKGWVGRFLPEQVLAASKFWRIPNLQADAMHMHGDEKMYCVPVFFPIILCQLQKHAVGLCSKLLLMKPYLPLNDSDEFSALMNVLLPYPPASDSDEFSVEGSYQKIAAIIKVLASNVLISSGICRTKFMDVVSRSVFNSRL